MSPTERRYSDSEREALACLWACEHWNFYLYGRRFTLVTDHQALKTLLSSGGSGQRPLRLHRWADRLFQYNFDVTFRPGRLNVVADALSRVDINPPASSTTSGRAAAAEDNEDDCDALVQTIFGQLDTSTVFLDDVITATARDDELRPVLESVVKGWPSTKKLSLTAAAFHRVRDDLSCVKDGRCLMRGSRVVIPAALHPRLLDLAHEGHRGVVRMKAKCREAIWWPGIDADIERHVKDCQACIVSGKSLRPSPGPLLPVQLPTGP